MLKLKPLLIVFSCCRPDRLRAYVDDIEIKAAHTVGEDQDLDTQIQVHLKLNLFEDICDPSDILQAFLYCSMK